MTKNSTTDPIAFRESFLAEATNTSVDIKYGPIFRVILFYLWRGCSLSQEAGKFGKCDPRASLVCLSTYEEFLAIIQLIRIGYHADAAILLRVLMERVAIIGYLGENNHLIGRYFNSEFSIYKDALAWAKKKSLPNWMILYGTLSGIVHSDMEGPAGHINNYTEIGSAFRQRTKKYPDGVNVIEELLGLTVYSLIALDPFALGLIQNFTAQPFSNDPNMAQNVGDQDFKEFIAFLQRIMTRDEKNPK